ncbi:dual specificity protein phosphatase family protein [uncultured Croceitalea sp.]|uniref:fused DSP-PTPase phosphatase/NAD kinase-like protein n=1 Tax=uncultured Croceitalea sp. TaxID=1798908 RepID=UPI0033065DAC
MAKSLRLGSLLLFLLVRPHYVTSQTIMLEKIQSPRFKRLYKLNDSIYRSEQPSKKGFEDLEKLGVKTSISFRRNKSDTKKAKKTGIELIHIPLKTAELTQEHLIIALQAIQHAQKPVLVHCWHGSDRTGAIMATYRIIFQDWTKKDAIHELRRPELGYHENWYPNVIDLLMDIDTLEIKKELGL